MAENPAQWRTISQAAAELGRSERTIRRWLESGRLQADRSKTPLQVDISGEVDTVSGQPPDRAGLQADNDRLQADNAGLQAEVTRLQGEVDRLQDVLDQVLSERDYLRTAHATTLTGIQKLIEAPGEKKWWQFWKQGDE